MAVADIKDADKLVYWINLVDEDLNCFSDKNKVYGLFLNLINAGFLRYYELPEGKGIIVYCITDNFKGSDCVNEIFMYIRKEFRGNVRLFKQLVNHLEEVAKEHNCRSVKIASNIGYNDDSVLRCLQRWGYKTDVVSKEIK